MLKPGTYYIGREFSTGNPIILTVHEGPRCGYECSCCEFNDGTAPCDHARDCKIFWDDCTCEGALERASERKREEDENG